MTSGPAKKGTLSTPTPNNSALTSNDTVLELLLSMVKISFLLSLAHNDVSTPFASWNKSSCTHSFLEILTNEGMFEPWSSAWPQMEQVQVIILKWYEYNWTFKRPCKWHTWNFGHCYHCQHTFQTGINFH